jgi:uncharacterized membrane protein SirB2
VDHVTDVRPATQRSTLADVAEEEHKGLSLFDGVLIVGGGIIAIFVAFALLSFVAGVMWFFIKLVVVVALIAFVAKLVFGRH